MKKSEKKYFGRRNLTENWVEMKNRGLSAPGQAWKEGMCYKTLKLFIGTR
jgi:hypothetical protein